MEEVARQYNAVEAVLWTTFALGFAVEGMRRQEAARFWATVMAVAFLAFGFSDYIEMSTGAWWQPVWLLILKVSCVITLTFGGHRYWRALKSKRTQPLGRANRRSGPV